MGSGGGVMSSRTSDVRSITETPFIAKNVPGAVGEAFGNTEIVFLLGDPLQVLNTVVVLDAVDMVDREVFGVGDGLECFENKTVGQVGKTFVFNFTVTVCTYVSKSRTVGSRNPPEIGSEKRFEDRVMLPDFTR